MYLTTFLLIMCNWIFQSFCVKIISINWISFVQWIGWEFLTITILVLEVCSVLYWELAVSSVSYRWTALPTVQDPDDPQYKETPYQRYGHTAVAWGDNAYVWGGRNDGEGACNILYCFDTGTWPFGRRSMHYVLQVCVSIEGAWIMSYRYVSL